MQTMLICILTLLKQQNKLGVRNVCPLNMYKHINLNGFQFSLLKKIQENIFTVLMQILLFNS